MKDIVERVIIGSDKGKEPLDFEMNRGDVGNYKPVPLTSSIAMTSLTPETKLCHSPQSINNCLVKSLKIKGMIILFSWNFKIIKVGNVKKNLLSPFILHF